MTLLSLPRRDAIIAGSPAGAERLPKRLPMNPFVTSLAVLAAAVPALAAAQAAPVKPGLWEVRSERQDGKQTAPSAEAMKNLTPETRAKVEAMMKQQGVAIGSDGANRVCLSKESLDAGRWQTSANCKTDFGSRSASAWKWHSVCPQTDTTIDGEAVFASPESYTVRPRRRGPFAATPRSPGRRCRPSGSAPTAAT